jgi:4-amino-4-deoxy-L-arabinose transferase-like glycosyltransferase
MPYWIHSMLAATPALAWVFFGLGLSWSLAILPRKDWHDRVFVVTLGMALGPMLLTAWMCVLGTLGSREAPLLRFDLILVGTIILAIIGAVLAWRKRLPVAPSPARTPLTADEKLLIGLIAAAVIIRWLGVAYWPFMAYDELWVFGYEGRLFTLLGHIPSTIGYYPQFIPLQYTYAQLAVAGVDDHAARAVLPFIHVASILAVYVLGKRLFNRRVGIFGAALWALYPHVAEWSRFGDLEVPVTFLFTLAATFFLMAWVGEENRRRYAIIAGIILGTGLWTKPTMGAFIWGVLLLAFIELLQNRLDWRTAWPRLQVALITGLAALPLGGVWYIRNLLLGHNPVDLPTGFWLSLAARSGAEFGWPLLALLSLLAYLYFGRHSSRPHIRRGVIGLALVLAGVVPSILEPHRMGIVEWLALAAGAVLLFVTLRDHARQHWTETVSVLATRSSWILALALPYFVTWFYSYSYHYRLSFAMVPLLLMPTAAIATCWFSPERVTAWHGARRLVYFAVIAVVSLPGIIATLYDPNAGWNWLWTNKLPDDFARYESGNAALMAVVRGFQIYREEQDRRLVVVAPGINRLPFFFPLEAIRIDETPTHLDQLEDVTFFVYGSPESRGAYDGIPLQQNQVVSALSLAGDHHDEDAIIRRAWWNDDGIFNYNVYELRLDNRFVPPYISAAPEGDVVFGGFARFLGHDIGGLEFWPGRRLIMHLYWEVLAPPPDDYMFFVHLRSASDDQTVWAAWDGPVTQTEDGRYYSTLVWEPGEYINDERVLELQNPETPIGDGYRLIVGMYKLDTGERVVVTVNGVPAGDGYEFNNRIQVQAPPE